MKGARLAIAIRSNPTRVGVCYHLAFQRTEAHYCKRGRSTLQSPIILRLGQECPAYIVGIPVHSGESELSEDSHYRCEEFFIAKGRCREVIRGVADVSVAMKLLNIQVSCPTFSNSFRRLLRQSGKTPSAFLSPKSLGAL